MIQSVLLSKIYHILYMHCKINYFRTIETTRILADLFSCIEGPSPTCKHTKQMNLNAS